MAVGGLGEKLQSFPTQLFEIADVSLVEGTIAGCNYSFFFGSPRNGIEDAAAHCRLNDEPTSFGG